MRIMKVMSIILIYKYIVQKHKAKSHTDQKHNINYKRN